MKVLIDIPKSTYKDIKESYSITCGENFAQKLVKYIKDGVPLPKGATNGDVIKAITGEDFSRGASIYNHGLMISEGEDYLAFSVGWWNAPYQRGE